MQEIRADRRSRVIDQEPESVRLAKESAARWLAANVDLARCLAVVERGSSHLAVGCSSVRDFAREQLRVPGPVVGHLLDLARALDLEASHVGGSDPASSDAAGESTGDDAEEQGDGPSSEGADGSGAKPPTVAERIEAKRIRTENAAILGSLYRRVGRIPAAEQAYWTQIAELESPWKLRQLVRKRIEEAAQREPTVPIAFQVTESARDLFVRAQDIASKKARQWLTEGQTFALVVRRFVYGEDERLVGGKRRRVPDTRTRPKSRYVPAEVRREILRRADGRCEVPGCSNGAFLELMHVGRAHRDGGSQEIDNLALGCTTHHFLLDAGVIRFNGWRDGRPVFLDARGKEFRERPRPPEEQAPGAPTPSVAGESLSGGVRSNPTRRPGRRPSDDPTRTPASGGSRSGVPSSTGDPVESNSGESTRGSPSGAVSDGARPPTSAPGDAGGPAAGTSPDSSERCSLDRAAMPGVPEPLDGPEAVRGESVAGPAGRDRLGAPDSSWTGVEEGDERTPDAAGMEPGRSTQQSVATDAAGPGSSIDPSALAQQRSEGESSLGRPPPVRETTDGIRGEELDGTDCSDGAAGAGRVGEERTEWLVWGSASRVGPSGPRQSSPRTSTLGVVAPGEHGNRRRRVRAREGWYGAGARWRRRPELRARPP